MYAEHYLCNGEGSADEAEDARTPLDIFQALIMGRKKRVEQLLDNSTNEGSLSKPKGRPLKQWKDEISLAIGGLDHVVNKITHLINFQLDFQNHGTSITF